MIEELRREDPERPVFVVDGGDLAWRSKVAGAGVLPAARRKGELMHAALALAGIDAMVPGDGDLALGLDWLREVSAAHHTPLLAANLHCEGGDPFPPSRVVTREGVTVGFVGVLGRDVPAPEGCEVTDPVEAARAALAGMADADLRVVLSHASAEADEALAAALPEIDLVVMGGSAPSSITPRALPGGALGLGAGTRGKRLGIAEITLVPGGSGVADGSAAGVLSEKVERTERRLAAVRKQLAEAKDEDARARARRRLEHVQEQLAELKGQLAAATAPGEGPRHPLANALRPLGEDVPDDDATLRLVEAAKADVAALERGERAARYAGPYVGSVPCRGCHAAEYEQWSGTPHAHAYDVLVREQRQLDRDCYACHVTGAHDEAGPRSPTAVHGLEDVGCESCHGPGRDHVADPAAAGMRRSPDEATCRRCHGGPRDGGRFDYAAYLPRVRH